MANTIIENFRMLPTSLGKNMIGKTKLSKSKDGVKIQATDIIITIKAGFNFEVSWTLQEFNYKGKSLKSTPKKSFRTIQDTGAVGTVELNENTLEPILSTFKEIESENLSYTNWAKMLIPEGTTIEEAIIGGAIAFVEQVEGIV